MTEFYCGTRIIRGSGALQTIAQFGAQRLLVVADPFFVENGVAARIAAMAPRHRIFDRIAPDPSTQLVAQGTAVVNEFDPDVIVALGGGSAMDCAKAMLYFSDSNAHLVAVPTTSGSGSEVTDFAVLTHEAAKYPLVDRRLQPWVAILDDELLHGLPGGLIADTGFDVLAHALEALAAKNADPITDALARDAFCTAFRALPRSFAGDKSARLPMHTAATMAGMAFGSAGLGLCHAMAHALGGAFHVPHGRLNAILLPAVLEVNLAQAGGKYASLSRSAGLGGSSDTMAVRSLKNALLSLRRQLELPKSLAQAGVEMSRLAAQRRQLLDAILSDPCCQTNPVPVTRELADRVLREVSGG